MSGENNSRKFKDDRVVNLINSNFITLKDKDMKRNNEILHRIINEVVATMKENNQFFKDHYQNIMFVGSYYKGTKVGKPEEFDLDLIIQLPLKYESIKFEGNVPGYTKLKLNDDCYKPGWERHSKILAKWVTPKGYLNQEEFRQYMESSLKNIPKSVTVGDEKYELNLRKSGPAFRLCVKGSKSIEMNVDLVPVLEFKSQPPVPGDFSTGSWFAVPKTKHDLTDPHLYWRMSFYDFEKAMLKKNGSLKPVIRQLKKLRDTADWKVIASYHIETLSLHRIKAIERNPELQKNSTTEHFMDMLVQLKEVCETNKIMSFWDKSHNLIENVKPAQLASIKGRLEKIIKQIERDPFAIADYILTKEERSSIENELFGYRNASKSNKTADQQPIKANYTFPWNMNLIAAINSMAAFNATDTKVPIPAAAAEEKAPIYVASAEEKAPISVTAAEEKASIPAAAAEEKAPVSTLVENKNSSLNSTEKNDGFAEIINIFKLIKSEIAETKDAINLLTRRVANIEEKIDIQLSRSNTHLHEEPIPIIH